MDVEGEVLVHLVGDDERVVTVRQLDDELERLTREDGARGIVGIVDEDDAGAVGDGGAEIVVVGLKVRCPQRDRDVSSPAQPDERRVLVVERLERYDFVAVVDEREYRRGECLGRTGGDKDFGVWIDAQSVEPLLVPGDRVAQDRHASAGRVLVDAV